MGRKALDLTGQVFGKLTVIKRVENDKRGNLRWLCKCECGNEKIFRGGNLTSSHTTSCGCYKNENIKKRQTKHNQCKTRLYGIWENMKNRCYNKNTYNYQYYGAKGITVCDEWKDSFIAFRDWSLANGYSDDDLTIDRIDNDLGYNPSNCRWATMKQQANNRRNNIYIEYDGRTQTLSQWCEELNMNYKEIYYNIIKSLRLN